MKKLISLLLVLLMIFTFCSCVNDKQIENDTTTTTSTTAPTTEDPDRQYLYSSKCVINDKDGYYEIPNEFKPFECSKNDYASLHDAVINGTTISCDNDVVSLSNDDVISVKPFRIVNGFENYCISYIDDSMYFISGKRVYKVAIDENGNYKRDTFSLVIPLNCRPIFVGENQILFSEKNSNEYYLLDTLTGEYEAVTEEMNKPLSKVPNGYISQKRAVDIALKEIKTGKYSDLYSLPKSLTLENERCGLYNNATMGTYTDDGYKEYFTEFGWIIYFEGEFRGASPEEYAALIDAKSGDVICADYYPNDN